MSLAFTSEYAAGYLPLCAKAMGDVGRGSQWTWQGKQDHFQKFLIQQLQPLQRTGEARNLKPRLTRHWPPFERESEITVHADDDADEHCRCF